jgi:hypothetical protein
MLKFKRRKKSIQWKILALGVPNQKVVLKGVSNAKKSPKRRRRKSERRSFYLYNLILSSYQHIIINYRDGRHILSSLR